MPELKATPLLKPNGQPTGMAMCPICNAVISEDADYRSHHSEDDKRLSGEDREEATKSAAMLLHPELLAAPIAANHPEMNEEQLSVLNMEVPTDEPQPEGRRKKSDDDKKDDDKKDE